MGSYSIFWWSRPIPDDLVLITLFQSKDTCKGDGRLLGFYWPGPGKIMNIPKPKFVSSVDLTSSFTTSEGCSILVQFFMAFRLV